MKKILYFLILLPIGLFGQIKVSQLPQASTITDNDLYLLTQGGVSKKAQHYMLKASVATQINDTVEVLKTLLRGENTWPFDSSNYASKSMVNDSVLRLHNSTAVAQNIKASDTTRWAASYTASNGITLSGSDFKLGGTLSESTYFTQTGSNEIGITSTDGDYNSYYEFDAYNALFEVNDAGSSTSSSFYLDRNSTGWTCDGSSSQTNIESDGADITVSFTGTGTLQYADDYSANYTSRSLVDSAFVGKAINNYISDDTTRWACQKPTLKFKTYESGTNNAIDSVITCRYQIVDIKAFSDQDVTYQWSDGGLYSTPTEQKISAYLEGLYYCTVTNSCDLYTIDSIYIGLDNQEPVTEITIIGKIDSIPAVTLLAQSYNSSSASFRPMNTYSYSWTGGGGDLQYRYVTSPGIYEVDGTNERTGCHKTNTITVTQAAFDVNFPKIYYQSTEPDIPNDTFAFWVDSDDSKYYMILDYGGTQKKIELL